MQDYLLWCSQMVGAMAAEESISDVTTADLQIAQHQQLWAEVETRQETYQQALDLGEELQTYDRSNRREVSWMWCQRNCFVCLVLSRSIINTRMSCRFVRLMNKHSGRESICIPALPVHVSHATDCSLYHKQKWNPPE